MLEIESRTIQKTSKLMTVMAHGLFTNYTIILRIQFIPWNEGEAQYCPFLGKHSEICSPLPICKHYPPPHIPNALNEIISRCARRNTNNFSNVMHSHKTDTWGRTAILINMGVEQMKSPQQHRYHQRQIKVSPIISSFYISLENMNKFDME